MTEVEVKARLRDPETLIKKLQTLGCVLSESIRQIDTVYTRIAATTVEEYLKNDHFVRIREKSDGRFVFTVKKPSSKTLLTKTEYETEIKNAKELEQALFLMGYARANVVIKNRRTAHYKAFEICIDAVDDLGSFIELEKMTDGDAESARRELNAFLSELGVSSRDEVHKGYDIMAIEKEISRKIS